MDLNCLYLCYLQYLLISILFRTTNTLTFKMQNQPSTYEQTLQLLQSRVAFFSEHMISAENALILNNSSAVKSISQIIPNLCRFQLNQTPINPNLADIYYGKDANKICYDNTSEIKFVLPPVSQGQDSITQQQAFQPSFKWISNAIIDSSYLIADKVEPKKVQRGRVNPEWKGIVQLLLFNVDRKIYLKSQMTEFQQFLKNRFQKFPWIKIKKIKELYYKGKPSILLKFSDQTSASFTYFNLATSIQKQVIGQACEILRVTQNKIKQKFITDVTLVFRKLPLSMTKEGLLNILKNKGIVWMEQLFEICGFKYTICKVSYLQQAFQVIKTFQSKNIKEAKINHHPSSAKSWKIRNQLQQF